MTDKRGRFIGGGNTRGGWGLSLYIDGENVRLELEADDTGTVSVLLDKWTARLIGERLVSGADELEDGGLGFPININDAFSRMVHPSQYGNTAGVEDRPEPFFPPQELIGLEGVQNWEDMIE